MTIKVDICNIALNKLGQERIASLNDDNKRARECSERIDDVIEDVLRDAFWNFAIAREVLAPSPSGLAWGDEVVYILPLDCLRVMHVSYGEDYKPRYKIEGRNLLIKEYSETDGVTDSIRIGYIRSSVPEGYFDSKFRQAVATKLAAELCYSMTQTASLKQTLLQEYSSYLGDARSINSQEVSPDDFKFNYFTNARRVGHEVYSDTDFS